MERGPVTLRNATEADLPYVETLLDANGLPFRDVREKLDCLYIGYDEDERIGIGGREVHGTDGLLRSLVVEEAARGQGLGTALCAALETEAQKADVETLYLLTTTAPEFFAGLGYAEIDRSAAPSAIRQTAEFEGLCPTTATCMRKSL